MIKGKFTHWSHIRSPMKPKRSPLDGRGRISFVNKDDPNYKRNYSGDYTDTQLKLLSGEIAWETTRISSLTMLLYKAEARNDTEVYKRVKEMRDRRIEMRDKKYKPDITADEAKEILRNLTPWTRDDDTAKTTQK